MGSKIEPTDEARPNQATGYCQFLRGGQVLWSPSFDVIGTHDIAHGKWMWGWADDTYDPRVRSRIEAVRKQGSEWGIDILANPVQDIQTELEAWELSTVATAVVRADAMYRIIDGGFARFLALFEGPPLTRPRMPSARSSAAFPAVAPPSLHATLPGTRSSSAMPAVSPSSRSSGSIPAPSIPKAPSTPRMPAVTPQVPPVSAASPATTGASEREPTAETRNVIGQHLLAALTPIQLSLLGQVTLVAHANAPAGPVGTVTVDMRLTLRPSSGDPDIHLTAPPGLHDTLAALWLRCREQLGAPYQFATARLERGTEGPFCTVQLDW